MVGQRRSAVVFPLALVLTPPFLSERSTPCARKKQPPPWPEEAYNQEFQRLLFTPTLYLHLLWIFVISSLIFVCFFDITLKLVFVCCQTAVDSLTPESLPAKRKFLRMRMVYQLLMCIIAGPADHRCYTTLLGASSSAILKRNQALAMV